MEKRITVYLDSDGPDLKGLIAKLKKRRDLPQYYRRSESAIAAMLLQERIEQVLDGEVGEARDRT